MQENVTSFISYLRAERGFSINTISAYQNDLGQLVEFIATEPAPDGVERESLTREQIVRFVLFLRQREYAPTTIARKIAAVKSFCRFLEQEGLLAEDPTAQ